MSSPSQRILAALVGLVFLWAGGAKALDPAGFAEDVLNYRLLPWPGVVALALYLPWLEILCGLAMVCHVAYRGALVLASAMLASFIIAYGSTRLRGLDVACGCFGHGGHRGWPAVLVGDALLLAASLYLLRADARPLSPVLRQQKNLG